MTCNRFDYKTILIPELGSPINTLICVEARELLLCLFCYSSQKISVQSNDIDG